MDWKNNKVCCPAANWDSLLKTCCSEPRCKVNIFGITVMKCCPTFVPGTTCQEAGEYDVCCATGNWDSTKKKCCSKPLCGTSCCDDGTCYDTDRDGKPDTCCPKGRWTGSTCCSDTEKACDGECIPKGTCCVSKDCPCDLPTGKMALACTGSSCQCTQKLCCKDSSGQRQCIQPNNDNCSGCGQKCTDGKICVQNTCLRP